MKRYSHWHFDPFLRHLHNTHRQCVCDSNEYVDYIIIYYVIAERTKWALKKMATFWSQQAGAAPYTSMPICGRHIFSPQMDFISQSECGQRFMPSCAACIVHFSHSNPCSKEGLLLLFFPFIQVLADCSILMPRAHLAQKKLKRAHTRSHVNGTVNASCSIALFSFLCMCVCVRLGPYSPCSSLVGFSCAPIDFLICLVVAATKQNELMASTKPSRFFFATNSRTMCPVLAVYNAFWWQTHEIALLFQGPFSDVLDQIHKYPSQPPLSWLVSVDAYKCCRCRINARKANNVIILTGLSQQR